MTQITQLEREVISSIAKLGYRSVKASEIHTISDIIKKAQVNAVLLNLKRKGMVTVLADGVTSLTVHGMNSFNTQHGDVVYSSVQKEHNAKMLFGRPMSSSELTFVNNCIELRNQSVNTGRTIVKIKNWLKCR
jgi:hypothetical protein